MSGVQEQRPETGAGEHDGTTPRLVVGDDGSAAADVVWSWVANHRWPGWRIAVLTAHVPETGPPVGVERATPHVWEPPHPRVLTDDDVPVEHLLAELDPRLALDRCASDAALLAVGPRGRGLMKHLHIGSTTEWLISAHRPLAPVVVVRSERRTERVLLCTDGSPSARSALDTLLALPWITTCRVHVLGVDDARNTTTGAVEHAVAALRARGVGGIEHAVVAAVPHTAHFDVRSVVLGTVADIRPDLVALGARGTGGLRGLVLGSVTSAVVRHAPCSVLVARTADHVG